MKRHYPQTYDEYCGGDLVLHIERCDYCRDLGDLKHYPECDECDHPWHPGECGIDRGDVPNDAYKGGMQAIGPCPCESSETLTEGEIHRAQERHADEEAQDRYEAYCDAKYQAWKDRGI